MLLASLRLFFIHFVLVMTLNVYLLSSVLCTLLMGDTNVFKVFVDGEAGTTGLQIFDRLAKRSDIEVLHIDQDRRKDLDARAELINASDVTFLCLPDDASRESATLCTNPNTIIIDASTAHRTNPAWTYGLPELSTERRKALQSAKRIANPGCHASGFLLGVAPLRSAGILSASARLACYSITGYSGGGKKLIAEYEAEGAQVSTPGASLSLFAPSPYALALHHKHLPEMKMYAELNHAPLFNPVLGPFYKGMAVSVALFPEMFDKKVGVQGVYEALAKHYEGSRFVEVVPYAETPDLPAGRLDCTVCNDTNNAKIYVFGNDDAMQVTTIIDNLGKGASGAAVQNMNIALGIDEATSLI